MEKLINPHGKEEIPMIKIRISWKKKAVIIRKIMNEEVENIKEWVLLATQKFFYGKLNIGGGVESIIKKLKLYYDEKWLI